ncbi:MAG TPA: S-layer homology domain-containing protein [Thermoanaerobaculia bacterium]|nr:S-layer homology domain-containing protein [Thermoanaerobaculia bacterium]
MRRTILAVLAIPVLFASLLSAADSWVSLTGLSSGSGAEGVRSLVPIAGGYALGGPTTTYSVTGQTNYSNFWLVTTDDLGNVTSQRSYYTGTEIFTNLNSILATSDGGFVLAGQTGSGPDVLLAKVDSSGAVAWSWRYGIGGSFQANKIIPTSDGGFAIAGQWKTSFALIKLASDGSVSFVSRFQGTVTSTDNAAVDVLELSDGFLLLGNQLDPVSQSDIRLLKTDKNGAFVWEKVYGGASNDLPFSLAATGDGGFVFTGMTESFGGEQVWVVRLDSTGGIVWQKSYVDTYSATHACFGYKIIVTADGGFLVAGSIGTTHAGLYKLDSTGTLQWAKAFAQGGGDTFFLDALQKKDGSYVAAGTANGGFFSPNDDFLVQVGPNGEFVGCLTDEFTPTTQVATSVTTSTATAISETGDSPAYTTSDPAVAEHDTDAPGSVCTSVLPAFLVPGTLVTDAHSNGETASNVNGVADPFEKVMVQPAWTNIEGTDLVLSSTTPMVQDSGLMDFEFDTTANYGTVAPGATADCFDATGDCFVGDVPRSDQRPSPHWDVHFDETLNGKWAYRWTIHIGGSFADVSLSDQFYKYIETLFHHGVTGGCGGGDYCPSNPVTRAQMAVFLLKGEHGGTYGPPTCSSTVFTDVPCPGGTFVDWVNQLASENITGGCGGGNYCPGNPVTRGQMAVFLLKAEHGGGYAPPTCSATIFGDVPCPGAQFVDWINQLSNEGITGGCGGGNYCPGHSVTRGQMAVFLSRTFALQLNAILP